jgi:hypothetical protein
MKILNKKLNFNNEISYHIICLYAYNPHYNNYYYLYYFFEENFILGLPQSWKKDCVFGPKNKLMSQ